MMKSIKDTVVHTTVIKKSTFITTLVPCSDVSEVNDLVALYGKEDATHNCVAYIINNQERADDDGEPGGTAGLPMLNVLKRQGLENILAIVTRYFGGIKLGAGGLTRAYTNSVADALKQAEIVEKELVKLYHVTIDYHYIKKMDYLIKAKSLPCINTYYDERVHYHLYIKDESFLKELQEMTANTFTSELIGEDYIPVVEG